MKKNKKLLLLGLAAAAAYFLFFRKPVSGDLPAKNLLANLIDQTSESPEYKAFYKSQIAYMTRAEAEAAAAYLQSGVMSADALAVYQKYSLGS